MKKILFLLLFVVSLYSCEKDLEPYKGGDGIYFDNIGGVSDTITFSWGMKPSDIVIDTLKLKVVLLGNVSEENRKFSITIKSDTTSFLAKKGIDYGEFPMEYVLPAGKEYVEIPIPLYRSSKLKDHWYRFTVQLVENEQFRFLYSRQKTIDTLGTTILMDIERTIRMDETFPEPWWWDSYAVDGTRIFGDYSQTKAALICDHFNISRETFLGDLIYDDFNPGLLKFWGIALHRYLIEHPTPDEPDPKTGAPRMMEMGPDSQI